MRGLTLAALALVTACSESTPPPIGDPDGALSQFTDDAYAPPTIVDAGDAGVSEYLDFAGACTPGLVPVWHFFDFQTHTPTDSSLKFVAQSADTEAALASAPSVDLATVTGPDITTWAGVDVDAKLQSIGQKSRAYLRVTIVATAATDGTQPALTHYRQSYDCLPGQ